jgi:signal transduction histidine kinase
VCTEAHTKGRLLGTVALAYDTDRIDALRFTTRLIGIIALALWLATLAYSVMFAGAFVRPIRLMMEFTRRVAGGELGGVITTRAAGELSLLSADLNQMSAQLAAREAERKQAAIKEAELQSELLAVSRMAGMAEVATGVLHNVGNVLNSLNVSVSTVGEALKQSKVSSLKRTMEMIQQHPDGLPGLLTTAKGKLIPPFLATVSQSLIEENARVRSEIDSVVQNLAHVKAIVSMQQSYARVPGVSEVVDLQKLIDDAVKMSEASLAHHQIELVKDYALAPALTVDRHKLMQILVNLVSNATQAIKAAGPTGTLTIRVERKDDRSLIIVRDTGVGISVENLDRIFQHGFTTKASGHGFGLHSSANAVRELGGRISVASDGPGLGATFTVELPTGSLERTHDHHN